jgi:hypothetical protein
MADNNAAAVGVRHEETGHCGKDYHFEERVIGWALALPVYTWKMFVVQREFPVREGVEIY